jgi:transcriptional regulator with XRE-family HTH domain
MGERKEVRAVVSAIGARVRRLRRSRGLSQIVLAELAGVHYNTLKRIESGDANPSIGVLLKLADTLGITVVQLLGGK